MNTAELTKTLRAAKSEIDELDSFERPWPQPLIDCMHAGGCFRHAVPDAFGGLGVEAPFRLDTYAAVAEADLSCALILTQHDAACELMASEPGHVIAGEVLKGCAKGDFIVTVGISQLTTSKRGGHGPAMRCRPSEGGFVIDGKMPWVTSANHAEYVVTGAGLDDASELLAIVPLADRTVDVQEAFSLLALGESSTAEVRCVSHFVNADHVLRGPKQNVLKRRSPVKSLTVTYVALGMARSLLHEIEATNIPESLASFVACAREETEALQKTLSGWAKELDDDATEVPKEALRAQANHLISQLATTLMVVSKGSGYVLSHTAQHLYREAAFFLVWSAPDAVRQNTLSRVWARNMT